MSLPPEIDSKIGARIDSLISKAQALQIAESEKGHLPSNLRTSFESVKTSFQGLLSHLGQSDHINHMLHNVRALDASGYRLMPHGQMFADNQQSAAMLGMLKSLKDDYSAGMLENIVNRVEATIASDYIGQAERLLGEGKPGKFDHIPAAVLVGAVLEDGLRRLCQRQNPPIPTEKPNGEPKTLNPLIDDLKKAGVFNELRAKQLRAWADIRNSAAHGEFGDFNRQDVEQMIKGVQNFLADYI